MTKTRKACKESKENTAGDKIASMVRKHLLMQEKLERRSSVLAKEVVEEMMTAIQAAIDVDFVPLANEVCVEEDLNFTLKDLHRKAQDKCVELLGRDVADVVWEPLSNALRCELEQRIAHVLMRTVCCFTPGSNVGIHPHLEDAVTDFVRGASCHLEVGSLGGLLMHKLDAAFSSIL